MDDHVVEAEVATIDTEAINTADELARNTSMQTADEPALITEVHVADDPAVSREVDTSTAEHAFSMD